MGGRLGSRPPIFLFQEGNLREPPLPPAAGMRTGFDPARLNQLVDELETEPGSSETVTR